jgi:hypothetical protein
VLRGSLGSLVPPRFMSCHYSKIRGRTYLEGHALDIWFVEVYETIGRTYQRIPADYCQTNVDLLCDINLEPWVSHGRRGPTSFQVTTLDPGSAWNTNLLMYAFAAILVANWAPSTTRNV